MVSDLTLYLIRHGQSKRNLLPNLIGQSPDEELSFKGEHQASLLGEYFRDHMISFDEIYTSPYTRALETCRIACEKFTTLSSIVDDRLREYSAGDALDKSREEFLTPAILMQMDKEGMAFKWPNGESLYEVEDRVRMFLKKKILIPRDNKAKIAIFSHGMTIKCLLHFIMKFDHKLTWRISIDNTSCSILNLKYDKWFLKSINDTRHLEHK